MGVYLTPIVTRHPTSLEALRGRSVAVDGNLELYQFLSIVRMRDGRPLMDTRGRVTSHLSGLMFRTTKLIAEFGIRPVFVFDGPPPELKRDEIARRRAARDKAKLEYESALERGDLARAFSKAVSSTRLTHEMTEEAQALLGHLGIPWVQAPSEGEAQAAFLARRGDVWAASSKDYDSLLFGTPRLIRFLAVASSEFLPSQGRSRSVPPEILDLEENLRTLGLTREQLVDVGLLIGTDFNEGVHGFGPKTALKRVREWGSLDRAPPDVQRQLPYNLAAIREFFLHPPVAGDVEVRRGRLDAEAVRRFLCDERDFSPERVNRALALLAPSDHRTTRLDDFP